jgi:N-acetylmuramoyl-L-alanine amidase
MDGMRLWVLALLLLAAPTGAAASPSENAFLAAGKSYRALKADPARRKLRHHWLTVARRFEAVAAKFPSSARAPESLFRAAELQRELSRLSGLDDDLQAAIADYQKLCARYSKHRLAADSALALATVFLERTGQLELARRSLKRALADNPKSPRAGELAKRLRSLPTAEGRRRSGNSALLEAFARASRAPGGEEGQQPEASDPPTRSRLRALGGAHKSGEATLSQQLGLKVHRVVIDAGHGGYDAGAVGARGTKEKDVALAIAMALRDLLTESGLEVVLTREDDSFVALEERARLANQARGDLFLSIHCNSARQRRLSGVETYTLNTSSDRYSIRLAARENSSSEKGISDLQYILADLATKANADESSRLAARVQQSLVRQLRSRNRELRDLGTKEALFYVLLGVRMPAILVETAFLSNPGEERLLSSKAYQEEIAAAIATGVQDFLGSRERVAKVN